MASLRETCRLIGELGPTIENPPAGPVGVRFWNLTDHAITLTWPDCPNATHLNAYDAEECERGKRLVRHFRLHVGSAATKRKRTLRACLSSAVANRMCHSRAGESSHSCRIRPVHSRWKHTATRSTTRSPTTLHSRFSSPLAWCSPIPRHSLKLRSDTATKTQSARAVVPQMITQHTTRARWSNRIG